MPQTHKLFGTRELENIKVRLQSGEKKRDVAKQFGRALSAVQRIAKTVRDGTFEERYLKPAREREDNPGQTPSGYKAVAGRGPEILKLKAKGWTVAEISKKLGTSTGSLSYWYYGKGGNAKKLHKAHKAKQHDYSAQIQNLRATGLSVRAVAEELHLTPGKTWGIIKKMKQIEHQEPTKEQSNGNSSAGGINKNILIGIAFAETERFIAVLSERLGVPADILRPRLSELLGHSPLR